MRTIGLASLVLLAACSQSSEASTEHDAHVDDAPVHDDTTSDGAASDDGANGGTDGTTPDDATTSEAAAEGGSGDASLDGGPKDGAAEALDPDGVWMARPTKASGKVFRLGSSDPNATASFEIERGTKATKKTEGKCTFWNLPSHELSYASGGTGWTTRLHIYASGTKTQVHDWKTQKGWLATPSDPKDQELTFYARPHKLLDPKRAAFSLKIRGGRHTASNPSLGSCTMMVFAGPETSGIARFGKELDHPIYDYVKLVPAVPAQLVDGAWVGLKLVSYTVPTDTKRVKYVLYVDRTPFDAATCKPQNKWEVFSTYDDVEGKDTGTYTKLADWGGMLTTFRSDGLQSIDFMLMSFREIVPPP